MQTVKEWRRWGSLCDSHMRAEGARTLKLRIRSGKSTAASLEAPAATAVGTAAISTACYECQFLLLSEDNGRGDVRAHLLADAAGAWRIPAIALCRCGRGLHGRCTSVARVWRWHSCRALAQGKEPRKWWHSILCKRFSFVDMCKLWECPSKANSNTIILLLLEF